MKRFLFAVFAIGTCIPALADYTIYGGDIATSNVSTDEQQTRILFAGKVGDKRTYTLSKDTVIYSGGMATAGSAASGMAGVEFDFTDGNHTLTLAMGELLIYQHHEDILFRGGVWDFNGKMFITVGKGSGAGFGYDNVVTLTNSCVMTNLSYLGHNTNGALDRSANYRFRLTDSSVMSVNGNTIIFNNGIADDIGVEATNMLFEISGGSRFSCKDFQLDRMQTGADTKLFRNNVFRVTGLGSEFSSPSGSFMMGYGTCGNVFEVCDHAKATVYYPRIGNSTTTARTGISVRDHGEFTITQGFRTGNESTDPNRGGIFFHALSGATATIGSTGTMAFTLNGSNCEAVFSNATLKAGTVRIGTLAGATNDLLRLSGKNLAFRAEDLNPAFGVGHHNRLVLDDGAVLTNANFSLSDSGIAGHHNTVSVSDGAELVVSSAFKCGKALAGDTDNAFVLGAGGRLTVSGNVSLSGTNSYFAVSNGVFTMLRDTSSSLDTYTVDFGMDKNYSSNNVFAVQGDHPVVRIPKTSLRFDNHSILRFDLPPNGYDNRGDPNYAPLDIQQIMNYTMDYEITGLDELQKNLPKSCDIPLIRMSYRMWDGDSAKQALNRINAKLAETNPGCRLWKQDNRQTTGGEIIYLHVKAHSGLMLIFR